MPKKVLVITEFTKVNTGFSTYWSYVLPKLFKTGKYELAELAVYANELHPNILDQPWKVYPNEPHPHNEAAQAAFRSDPANQFGKWRFDEVCLDFKPDICITIADPWMSQFIFDGPYRKHYKILYMPTVDGEPQRPEWMDQYKNADKLLTYSYFGKHLLERQSFNQIAVDEVASPGADIEVFKPIPNKMEVRKMHLFPNDAFIINTVMRNQPRKLFPDLFRAFIQFLQICKDNNRHDLAAKTFLHCHTTNPDVGWDLAAEIQKHNLSHKVLLTYMCNKCGWYGVLPYIGDKDRFCPRCGEKTLRLPNTGDGLSREQLAKMMGCADLYIQFATNEGFGMGINDAKSCGVPAMMTNYSAMSEQAFNGGGLAIPVERYFQESIAQTNQLRALPDIGATASMLFDFFSASQEYRDKLGYEARECIEKHYTWESVANKWERVIDSTMTPDQKFTWLSQPAYLGGTFTIPNNITHSQFIAWCYENILKQPEMIQSAEAQKMLHSLITGSEVIYTPEGKPVFQKVDRESILNYIVRKVKHYNALEMRRFNTVHNISMPKQEYFVL